MTTHERKDSMTTENTTTPEDYITSVAKALTEAGVPVIREWAQTRGADDPEPEVWEGGIEIHSEDDLVVAWDQNDGWYLVRRSTTSVQDLERWVDAPVERVVEVALPYLPVLIESRPEDVVAGDQVFDGGFIWRVTDRPLVLPDGTVAVWVREVADPEEAVQLGLDPEATLRIRPVRPT